MPSIRRRRVFAVALVTGLAAAVPAPAVASQAPAGIAVSEITATPADGVFHLEGHGYGGGVGLSQWGAEGGAESGASAAAILTHYYPTTTLSTVAASTIRVLLSGLPVGPLAIGNASGLTVTGADGTAVAPPSDAAHAKLRLVPTGNSLQLQNSPDGTNWSVEATVTSPAAVTDSAALLTLVAGDGSARSYRGRLSVASAGNGTRVIDTLALEDYLRGVVPRESPPSWRPAALQAQAVAARTYAAYLASRATAGAGYDICDTSTCQVYGGAGAETANTDAAVAATAGQELTVAGAPIAAEYGASNGGYTIDGGQPYLPAVADPWDGVDAGNTSFRWTAAVTSAELQARYPAVGTLTGIDVTSRDGNGEWGGRVLAVTLLGRDATGAATSVRTTGGDLVNARAWPTAADGLRSSWWHVVGQTSTIAATPSTLGLSPVAPFRVVETSRLGTTATRVIVAGTRGVPVGATAVFVIASAGRLAKATRADLLAWPSGGNRSGAVALDRLSGLAPTSGSGLVALGPDGAIDVATSTSTVGLELTVVGWSGTAATGGISLTSGAPVVLKAAVRRGSRSLSGLKPPAGAVAALVAVTASASTGAASTGASSTVSASTGASSTGSASTGASSTGSAAGGSLTVGGVPTQSLTAVPQTTTTLLPLANAAIAVSRAANVRVQLIGWLTPAGVRLTAVRPLGRPVTSVGRRGAFVQVSGGAVPAASTAVVALLTETSSAAGDLVTYPHGSTTGPAAAAPAGRAATTLMVTGLKDGLLVVKPPVSGAKVQLTILGWAG